ncbi:hypothetical protein B4099_3351 [Heyndrickxia coagulans]|uniref:Uncharacterized protein n=1 Tax=Heyndrickxia coagulans TaxID=1398 RepID=A0A150K749_HEYCO|nr:hypothetical protein B4099_3351 [Heyndrickxia coagulans]
MKKAPGPGRFFSDLVLRRLRLALHIVHSKKVALPAYAIQLIAMSI